MTKPMRRAFVLSALLLTLSACDAPGSKDPFTDSRVPPSVAPRFYPPEGWAWGLVQVGAAPPQRYGVSTPPVAPKATVLILAGYADPAEVWFETVRDLNAKGYAVWVLEREGQGGSARLSGQRDLGHAVSFDPDIAAVRAMVRTVIRPSGDIPLVLIGHSLGGLVALRVVESGVPADGVVLSVPAFEIPKLPTSRANTAMLARAARTIGLGGVRIPGQHGYRRESAGGPNRVIHDAVRQAMRRAWPEANPDLRMGGPSLGWLAAFYDATDAAQQRASTVAVPALLINAGDDIMVETAASQRVCKAMKQCQAITVPNAWHDLPREADPARDAWLNAVDGFVKQRIAAPGR